MPAAYSADIRGRGDRECGEWVFATREAAEEFDVSPSSAIKWVATLTERLEAGHGQAAGGSTSALEKHANFFANAD